MTIPRSPAETAALVAELIGKPWAAGATGPDAFDCWGLVAEVQARVFGRDLPEAAAWVDAARPRDVIEAIRASALHRRWLPVDRPRPGDLVLMGRRDDPVHVGVWVRVPGAEGCLHAVRGQGVILQSLAQLRAGWMTIGFRRDAGRALAALPPAPSVPDAADAAAVIVRDALNPLDGATLVPLPPGLTVADALAGLPDLPSEYWVCLDAEPLLRRHPETGEDEWTTRRVAPGQVLWILPPPPLGDQGGSQILAVVAAIAIAIAAPYAIAALGVAALGTTAATLTTLGQLAAAGLALGANMIIAAFVPQMQAPTNTEPAAPSPTYSVSAPGNQARPGATVPCTYGTMRRQPELLAQPFGDYAGNEHTLYLLLCVGLGAYRINEIGIEDTAVWTASGGFTGALEDVEIEIVPPGEVVTLFPVNVITNYEVGGQELPPPDEDGPNVVGPFVAVPPGLEARQIIVDFLFPRGLFDLVGGRVRGAEVTWSVDIRPMDDEGRNTGTWSQAAVFTRRQATTTPQRLTRRIAVAPGRWRVRCRRLSASGLASENGQDQIVWAGLRVLVAGSRRFDDVTAVAIRMQANETSSQGSLRWYVDATRILPHWDAVAGAWVEGPTEAIEAAALDVMRSDYGLGLADERIDFPALERLAEVWSARGDVCCLTVDTPQAAWDVLDQTLMPGRARAQFIGNTVTVVRDEPKPMPVQLITPADMVRGSFSVDRLHFRRESPNVVTVRYRDRQGRLQSVTCQPPGVITARPATVDAKGIVDHAHAWRHGVYLAASNNLRRRFVRFTLLGTGRALVRGDPVAVAHPRPAYGRPARLVRRTGITLTLSEPHGIDGSGDWYASIQRPDGSFWGPVRVVQTPGGTEAQFDFATPDFWELIDDMAGIGGYSGDPRDWMVHEFTLAPLAEGTTEILDGAQSEPTRIAVGRLGAETLRCLVVELQPRADGTVEVLAVQDDAGVHTAEEEADMPAAAAAATTPGLPDAPAWAGANAVIEQIDGGWSIIVSGPSVPGAVGYVAEISIDGGESWGDRVEALAPRLVFPAPDETAVMVRWAALGTIRGPWGQATLDGTSGESPAPMRGFGAWSAGFGPGFGKAPATTDAGTGFADGFAIGFGR